jgi:hypothetical protein
MRTLVGRAYSGADGPALRRAVHHLWDGDPDAALQLIRSDPAVRANRTSLGGNNPLGDMLESRLQMKD